MSILVCLWVCVFVCLCVWTRGCSQIWLDVFYSTYCQHLSWLNACCLVQLLFCTGKSDHCTKSISCQILTNTERLIQLSTHIHTQTRSPRIVLPHFRQASYTSKLFSTLSLTLTLPDSEIETETDNETRTLGNPDRRPVRVRVLSTESVFVMPAAMTTYYSRHRRRRRRRPHRRRCHRRWRCN